MTLWQVSFLERETLPRIKSFRWNFTSFLFWTKWFRNVLKASHRFSCFLSNFLLPSQTNLHLWPNQWRKLSSDDIILTRIALELYPSFARFCMFKQFCLFHGEGAILICSCFYELFYCSLRKKATNHNNFAKLHFPWGEPVLIT